MAYSPTWPTEPFGPLPVTSVPSVSTLTGTVLNDCPPVDVTGAAFHSKIPNTVFAVSNQCAPSTGSPPGAVALGESSDRSMSALAT